MNRKKPSFIRRDWHKRIKLGQTIKKKRKWRKARGMDNKIRLSFKGYPRKVKIGWGNKKEDKGKINGTIPVNINNLKQLEGVSKGSQIIIGKIGKKKRDEVFKKAEEMNLKVLNKYKKQNAAK